MPASRALVTSPDSRRTHRAGPELSMLRRLAEALGVSVEEVLKPPHPHISEPL